MLCNFRYRNLAKDSTVKRKHIEGRKKYMLKVVYDQNPFGSRIEVQTDHTQLSGKVFSPRDIWKKTIPSTFIAFYIWCGYLCPPHKILGGLTPC